MLGITAVIAVIATFASP
ncbi:hypothetical protein AB6O49_06975 [Streptomyces sp. SBR177]